MRSVRWTSQARTSYLRFLRDLVDLSQPAAVRAETGVDVVLERLAINPGYGRRSRRWPRYYEWSLTTQHKLLVYESDDHVLHVVAFYDMRQDLDAVSPSPEQR